MAFERMYKRSRGGNLPENSISISKSTLCFSSDLKEKYLKNFRGVEIFIDKENKQIGFKESNDSLCYLFSNKRFKQLARIKNLNDIFSNPIGVFKITRKEINLGKEKIEVLLADLGHRL